MHVMTTLYIYTLLSLWYKRLKWTQDILTNGMQQMHNTEYVVAQQMYHQESPKELFCLLSFFLLNQ